MKALNKQNVITSVFLALSMLIASFTVQAGSDYDGSVPPSPKAFYDVNLTDPYAMPVFLGVINDTYDLFISKGAPPQKIKFVISLRGLAVTFVTNDFGVNGTQEEQELGENIRELLDILLSKGVRIEVCEISCDWLLVPALPPGTDLEEVLYPGILIIDNAFASSIWYQTKGYAAIAIY